MVLVATNPTLHCPIRGTLKIKAKAKDGLTFTEEKFRIDCLRFLLSLGYPKDRIKTETIILQFGNKGTNSLRSDVVVYDQPLLSINTFSPEKAREHIVLIAEIKRDSKSVKSAKDDQLKPAMSFTPNSSVLGIYWDDVEQTLFYKEQVKTVTYIREASISHLPHFGQKFKVKPIRHSDLRASNDLVKIFSRFDDVLHQAGHDLEERYDVLLQIILIKIYDEQNNKPKNDIMIIQDFSTMSKSDVDIMAGLNAALQMSLVMYQKHLVKKMDETLNVRADVIKQIATVLCQVNLLGSSPQVMQDFYMYFARHIYKVDLAQYFTPYEVVDFIVGLTNPKFGDSIKDPACGSADFLVAAYRMAKDRHGANVADQVHGTDSGVRAIQISVLNMILNGDGKSKILHGDSLVDIKANENVHTLMLCNPPFGKDIVERRPGVLKNFELAKIDEDTHMTEQETGILFVEVCVRSARAGSRIAIILPNGYLGNRSEKFAAMRRWLFQHVRVAAVVGFPRFTFKKSGADVSASVLILEKLAKPVNAASDVKAYPIYFGLLNKVGWDVRNKRAERVYKVLETDGSPILDEENNPQIDADFASVLEDLYSSPVVEAFPWIAEGISGAGTTNGWAISSDAIFSDPSLIIDPKRWCKKYQLQVEAIAKHDHVRIGDLLDFAKSSFKRNKTSVYKYVEIANIFESFGTYDWEEMRGWSLPGRAKHLAKVGDVFIAHIWSSVGKWFIAGDEAKDNNLLVTSGCYHMRLREGAEKFLPDLIFGLSTESFRVQMRALATGSDGLSVVSEVDLLNIVIPTIKDAVIRNELRERLKEAGAGQASIARIVSQHVKASLTYMDVPERSSHVAQV